MAGNYADVPGRKFPIEMDGTAGFWEAITGTGSPSLTSLSGAEMIVLSSETGTTKSRNAGDNTDQRLGLVFPELRDIVGVNALVTFAGSTTGRLFTFETSTNSTNTQDGTWTTQTAPVASTNYRVGTQAYSITGVKAVRWYTRLGTSFPTVYYANIHVYGSLATGAQVDRLRLWHPTLNQELTGPYFDQADVSRTYTYDKTFRVKNNSATLTANSVVVSVDALTDTSPTVVSQYTISQGGAFAATQTITSLAAGAISAVCTLRYAVSSTAILGLWRQRLIAAAGSWT